MATPLILNGQKLDIVKVLESIGLTPADFAWSDWESTHSQDGVACTIKHKTEAYYYQIDRRPNGYWEVDHCPADKKWTRGPESFGRWDSVVNTAKEWATYVASEMKAKSYLAIAMNSPQLLRLPEPEDENSPFSEREQQQLFERLDCIEERLLCLREGDDDFRLEVGRNIQCLRDEVARGGRTAFRYTLFGAILSVGLAFLSPEETKLIIEFATQQINSVSQLLTHSQSG